MSKFKVLALAATLIMATAGLAIAGDCGGKASAETASTSSCDAKAAAETAAAKTASAEACVTSAAAQTVSASGCDSKASAETAAVKTASAGCVTGATAQTAGAGCTSGAAVKTAGAECSSEAKAAAQTVQIETVRMPSGAMAVFYNGTTPETVAFLQSKVDAGCTGFVCDMAKGMAADENVTTEIAATEHGVMILVTSKDSSTVDKYEEQYAVIVASHQQGE